MDKAKVYFFSFRNKIKKYLINLIITILHLERRQKKNQCFLGIKIQEVKIWDKT